MLGVQRLLRPQRKIIQANRLLRLCCKLRELEIMELREKARQFLVKKFDIKNFHEPLLEHGALPLNPMEDKINRWIEAG